MRYLFLALLIFLSGCTTRSYKHTQEKIVIVKSKKLKFADIAYIRHNDADLELELFVAGKAIEKISLNHLICTNDGCMSKARFNETFLYANYPDTLLENVLLGKEIYKAKNRRVLEDGFEQKIITSDIDINYSVNSNIISFKDKKNRIIIKIKELKN